MEFLQGRKRTNRCAEFSAKQVGKRVVVLGWAENVRNLGAFLFLTVRDVSGKVQLLVGSENAALVKKAQGLKPESVIYAEGVVCLRQPQNVNSGMATGDIEISVTALEVLSEAQPLPVNSLSSEAQKLKYRYLDLRSERLQEIAITRHKITTLIRNYLDEQSFLEVETPILGKSTPEGARDYLVPSRVNEHAFYALPQSPQIYKQLLMISGFDRYFQIAKCFRDEDLRANRQPEFTQVDMEMSFVDDENQVMDMVEGLVKKLFKEIKGVNFEEMFPRMTYAEAMARYGSDKPDLRFGLPLQNISKVFEKNSSELFNGKHVVAVKVEGGADKFSRKEQDKLTLLAKTHHAKGLFVFTMQNDGLKSSVLKVMSEKEVAALVSALDLKVGDIVFACAETDWEIACGALGAVRLNMGEKLNLIDTSRFATLWVTEFPMFEWDNAEGRLYAKHHPFTSPMFEDLHMLNSSPTSVRSKAYDLVINGQEVGGGSVRIYNNQLQKQVFNALGFSDEEIKNQFGFFIEAFNYGVPPHAGLALGLDRLVMLFTDTDNIKDVIAFPKTQSATCLMTQAPAAVSQKQLDELHIKLKKD